MIDDRQKRDCLGLYRWDYDAMRDIEGFPPGAWQELDHLRKTFALLLRQPETTSRRDLYHAVTTFRAHPRYREIMN